MKIGLGLGLVPEMTNTMIHPAPRQNDILEYIWTKVRELLKTKSLRCFPFQIGTSYKYAIAFMVTNYVAPFYMN